MKTSKLLFQFDSKEEADLVMLLMIVKAKIELNCIFLLEGEMASGKTTFARHFCESFGLTTTQSPTYAIHQRYENNVVRIDHLDLYRLENEEQIETAGLWDLLSQKNNLVLIEWSEKLKGDWFPLDRRVFKLNLKHLAVDHYHYDFFELS